MSIKPFTRGVAPLIAALLVLYAPAAGAGFLGKSIEVFSFTGDNSSPQTTFDTSLVVDTVGGQIEYDAALDVIDLSDNTIRLGNNDRNCIGSICDPTPAALGDFFGFRILDHLDLIAPLTGVSIQSSTIPGFAIGDVTFSGNEIFIGIERLGGYSPGDVIPGGEALLNISFAEIPEPVFGILFPTALLGIFAIGRRRRAGV